MCRTNGERPLVPGSLCQMIGKGPHIIQVYIPVLQFFTTPGICNKGVLEGQNSRLEGN